MSSRNVDILSECFCMYLRKSFVNECSTNCLNRNAVANRLHSRPQIFWTERKWLFGCGTTKKNQDAEHSWFFVRRALYSTKRKRLRQIYKKKCRSARVYLRKGPCKSSAVSIVYTSSWALLTCVYWLSTLLSIC